MLKTEIEHLAKAYGLENLGFLTLTFSDHVTSIKEAQRRFHSLVTHVIKPRYKRAIAVWEPQASKRIHFHLVVVVGADIRTGFDFEAIGRRDYRSASAALRSEWAFWRSKAPAYRFGRTELLPVKSSAEGIARYVGKYISKAISQREENDKGARLVRFIGYKPTDRTASTRFAWNSDSSWLWRQKVAAWAARYGVTDYQGLRAKFGPKWAYRFQGLIVSQRLGKDVVYPSSDIAGRELDFHMTRSAQRVAGDYKLKHWSDRMDIFETVSRDYLDGLKLSGDWICTQKGARGALCASSPAERTSKRSATLEASDNDVPADVLSLNGRVPSFDRIRVYQSDIREWCTVLIPSRIEQPF